MPDPKELSFPKPVRAIVLDDAFDQIQDGEITLETYGKFFQLAGTNRDITKAIDEGTIELPEPNEFESDDSPEFIALLNKLWDKRNVGNFKQFLLDRLFPKRNEKLSSLEKIVTNIRLYGILVKELGSDSAAIEEELRLNQYDYVFIDYYLAAVEGEPAVDVAARNLRTIQSKYPEGKKPSVILMSSVNVEDKAEDFYRRAQIMEGIPRFSRKSDLENQDLAKLILEILKKDYISKDHLVRFGEAVTNAAEIALERFKSEIGRLSIDDFLFIQSAVLQSDKQPLGDYLAWMYSSYWGHLLFQDAEFQKQSRLVSTIYLTEQMVFHRPPSDLVSEMYMSSLFETLDVDITSHPRYETPYLHLGDLLVSEFHMNVWMIINPQCDLERVVPLDRSILLLPGKLVPVGKQPDSEDSDVRTEFFRFKGNSYRILWEIKSVVAQSLQDFVDWKSQRACKRLFRLRLPFALELQQIFTSNIARVGMPVPPPLTQPLHLQVGYWNEQNKKYDVIMQSESQYISRVVTRQKDTVKIRYVISGKFYVEFKRKLIELHAGEKLSEKDASGDIKKAIAKNIEKLEKAISEYEANFLKEEYLDSKKLKNFGGVGIKQNGVLDEMEKDAFVIINIIDPEIR